MPASTLQSVVGFPTVVAVAIPGAMLLPTDVSFVEEVRLPVHDGLTCPKPALSDSNPGSWLAMVERVTASP